MTTDRPRRASYRFATALMATCALAAPELHQAAGLSAQTVSGGSGVAFTLAPYAGQTAFGEKLEIGDKAFGGALAGVDFNRYLGLRGYYWRAVNLESRVRWEPLMSYGGEARVSFLPWLLDGYWMRLSPHLLVGGGVLDYMNSRRALADQRDDQGVFIFGGGVDVALGRNFRLGFEARDYLASTPGNPESNPYSVQSLQLSGSLGFVIGGGRRRSGPPAAAAPLAQGEAREIREEVSALVEQHQELVDRHQELLRELSEREAEAEELALEIARMRALIASGLREAAENREDQAQAETENTWDPRDGDWERPLNRSVWYAGVRWGSGAQMALGLQQLWRPISDFDKLELAPDVSVAFGRGSATWTATVGPLFHFPAFSPSPDLAISPFVSAGGGWMHREKSSVAMTATIGMNVYSLRAGSRSEWMPPLDGYLAYQGVDILRDARQGSVVLGLRMGVF